MNHKNGKQSHRSRVYYQLALYYEAVFARFFRDHAWSAIDAMQIPPGAKVLEAGVGTGLSLPAYPKHADVVGIDLSEDMLSQAQEKIDDHDWGHIKLQQMDAQELQFDDAQFDFITAFHVVSVVPDPDKMIAELVRVAKPNATILIVNHFRSERPWLAPMVDLLDPFTRRLGWRTTLRIEDVLQYQPLEIESRYKPSPRSLFTVVQAKKPSEQPVAGSGSRS